MNNMIERKIRLSDTEEVKEFVRAAGKCDFDIDVCYNRAVIDAKSLLGMLYLGLSKDLYRILKPGVLSAVFYGQILAESKIQHSEQ